MANLSPLGAEETTGAARETFDELLQSGRGVPELYRFLTSAPEMLKIWAGFASGVRSQATLSSRLRVMLTLRAAHMQGFGRQWRHHLPEAGRQGIAAETVHALTRPRDPGDDFDRVEGAILDLVDAMALRSSDVRKRLASVADAIGPDKAVEVVVTVAYDRCLADLLNAFGLD